MTAITEINILKNALIKLRKEEPIVFNSLMKDVIEEDEKDEEFDLLIQKSFDRFGDTYRALA
jgi:hypothetical protein